MRLSGVPFSMSIARTLLGAALLALLPAPALATAFVPQDEEEEAAAEEQEEEESKWFAVVGGDVHTGTGAVLRGATVLSKSGRIHEIGYDLFIPDDAEVVDATGYRVYPGLVAISSFGLFGGGSGLEDTVDPFNQNMTLALGGGVTTAVQGNEAAKLKRGEIDGLVLRDDCFVNLNFTVRTPATKRTLRERFEEAAQYLRDYRQWQKDVKKNADLKEPKKPGDSSAVDILRGEATARFSANERSDLLEIALLAQQYGFRPVIEGCAEGWTVADELGRAGAMAVVTPRYRRAREETITSEGGSSIENAARLHAAGVPVAIVPSSRGIDLGGIVGRDLMHLTVEAAFAVRGGLSEEAALAGITIVPARMLGIDHRVGTLEPGKDCDLLITDGDLLHYETFVQLAVIEGKVVYDKQDELFFAHIRPRPDDALAPVTRVDPGETATPEEGGEEQEGDDDSSDEGDDD